jgi:hypothetical protein
MTELHHVRRLAGQTERVETGPIMFEGDWPGTFIRGDDAHNFACMLRELLFDRADIGIISRKVLEGLLEQLEASNARNNDAFPAWHQGDET